MGAKSKQGSQTEAPCQDWGSVYFLVPPSSFFPALLSLTWQAPPPLGGLIPTIDMLIDKPKTISF